MTHYKYRSNTNDKYSSNTKNKYSSNANNKYSSNTNDKYSSTYDSFLAASFDPSGFTYSVLDGFVFEVPESTSSSSAAAGEHCQTREGGSLADVDSQAKTDAIKQAATDGRTVTEPMLIGTQ